MKTYKVLYAEDVPHYGYHDIEAEDDQAAIEAAVAFHESGDVSLYEAAWDSSVCARIVHIEDPDGNIIAEDKPLDDYFLRGGGQADRLLCDAAENLFKALKKIAVTPLWGERIEDEDRKRDPAIVLEYDLEDDEYTPSGDTEHDQLQDVVETARAAVAPVLQSASTGDQP
jgi:hypothetical protein